MKAAIHQHESFSITSASHGAILSCLLSGNAAYNNKLHLISYATLAPEMCHFMTHSCHTRNLCDAKASAGICIRLNDVYHSDARKNRIK